ncbi:MAG TPA: acyltransferase [Polyangiales bacterium]|nr:acyltransferase [Polyangiales bacterium]
MTSTRFLALDGRLAIEGDWYPGTIPRQVEIDPTAYVGSSQSFTRYRSRKRPGLIVGRAASLCDATSLDIGPRGVVRLGAYALVTAARIICDAEVDIGAGALVSWDVVLMDSYRVPLNPEARRAALRTDRLAASAAARPIRLGPNSWIGFGACVLPGVSIGEGSIVAARSVVASDVPPYVVVAGNPASVVRELQRDEISR